MNNPSNGSKRRFYPLALIALMLVAFSCRAAGDAAYGNATVIKVYDGDTVKVRMDFDGAKEKVRFSAIDCPEDWRNEKFERDIKKPGALPPDVMLKLGGEARDYVKDMAGPGARVRLEFDTEKRDRYGRLLAYVWVKGEGGEVMLNEELLKRGLARAVDYGQNHRHLEHFRELEAGAKKARLGIWSK